MGRLLSLVLPDLTEALEISAFCTVSWSGRRTASVVFEAVTSTPTAEGEHSCAEVVRIDAASRRQQATILRRLRSAGWSSISGDGETWVVYARPNLWGPRLVRSP
jgi:hypothetical protein